MRVLSLAASLLAATIPATTLAQFGNPFVQLPQSDFIWNWGNSSIDERNRPDFEIVGYEQRFSCDLSGEFRPASRLGDFENVRDFEQYLRESLAFIQDATYLLNDLYRANQLDWAVLDCQIPEREVSEEKAQERMDRALERAIRQRERRRERDADDD